jgi:hypothetical protein
VNQIVETIRANSNPNVSANAEALPVTAAQASVASPVANPKPAIAHPNAMKGRN